MNSCYHCDKPGTTTEHVPPRCFFKEKGKGIFTLMTVPSCVQHNTKKSNSDEYLKFILTSTSSGVHREIIDRTVRGIIRLMKKRSRSLDQYGFSEDTGESNTYTTDGTTPVDVQLVQEALTAIARAVYYYDSGMSKKMPLKLNAMPLFLGLEPNCPRDFRGKFSLIESLMRKDLIERPIRGANQDVFGYQVIEEENFVLINMIFYRQQYACVISQR